MFKNISFLHRYLYLMVEYHPSVASNAQEHQNTDHDEGDTGNEDCKKSRHVARLPPLGNHG